jgi:threonine dehydratase
MVRFEDIEAAALRIAPAVVRTPLLRSAALDARVGARIYVKAECLQRFGSFKIRGAYNRIAGFAPAERARGVIAFSSGNHGIAVAGAARDFDIRAVIVMPADAPAIKVASVRALGAEIVAYDRRSEDREAIGARLAQARGLALVKPFDDPWVIAGQGTIGLEIAAALAPDIAPDIVVAPASGGGLVGGLAVALAGAAPAARVFAVEPAGHDDIARSLALGAIQSNAPGVRSICDALLVERPGALTFEIARAHLAGAVQVGDDEVRAAMAFAFAHLKIVLEPSGAAGLAALLSGALGRAIDLKGRAIAVVASGGNVDAPVFSDALRAGA